MTHTLKPAHGKINLARIATTAPRDIAAEADVAPQMAQQLKDLYDLAYLMFAENRRSLLVVLQGIDASGKDGLVRHIASGLNPQGLKVHSFKRPSELELDHDYLWRVHAAAPGRGEIAIFNRSHYEEVTVVKVHPELIAHQMLPAELADPKKIFRRRYRQIRQFERMLVENGTVIVKFFLHVSKDVQEKRFEERLRDPRKHWKFSKQDLYEREYWDAYRDAFEEMISETSSAFAPWYVVPADVKWYRNYAATGAIIATLRKLHMTFPTLRNE